MPLSAIAYAYLSDLPSNHNVEFEFAMQKCNWFTRGWGLQKLIAPKDLEFYDQTWSTSRCLPILPHPRCSKNALGRKEENNKD